MQWIYNYFIQPVSHSYGQYCVGGSLWCQIPYNDSTLSLSLTHEYSRKAQRCNREGEWCNATKGLQFTSLDLHALFPPSLDLIKSDILLPFFPLSQTKLFYGVQTLCVPHITARLRGEPGEWNHGNHQFFVVHCSESSSNPLNFPGFEPIIECEYSSEAQWFNREGEWCNGTNVLKFTYPDLLALFPPFSISKSLTFSFLSLKPRCCYGDGVQTIGVLHIPASRQTNGRNHQFFVVRCSESSSNQLNFTQFKASSPPLMWSIRFKETKYVVVVGSVFLPLLVSLPFPYSIRHWEGDRLSHALIHPTCPRLAGHGSLPAVCICLVTLITDYEQHHDESPLIQRWNNDAKYVNIAKRGTGVSCSDL